MDNHLNTFFSEGIILKVRLVTYSVLTAFSLFVIIGVSVMKDEFLGHCPLFFDAEKEEFGPKSNCDYPLAMAIIFQIFYSLYRLITLVLLLLGKLQKNFILFSDVLELVYLVVDAVAFLFTFIGACILSAGHNATCDPSCREHPATSASNAAQAGAWISSIIWLLFVIVGFLFLWRGGKIPCLQSNKGAESAPRATDSRVISGTTNPAMTTEDEAKPKEKANAGYVNVTPTERAREEVHVRAPEERKNTGNMDTPVVQDDSLWPNMPDDDDTYCSVDMDC